jgi:hypothetical protein
MAVRPKVGSDVDVDEEAAPKVDDGLAKLYETWQKRETANNQQLVLIVEYVRDNKLKKKVVKATLESRGLTPSSVSSEVSRIIGLSKPENAAVLQALSDGEITIAAARKAIAKPQERPALDNVTKVWRAIYRGAELAYKFSKDDPTFSLKYFTQEAANAWSKAEEEYLRKEAEAEEAAEESESESAEEEMAEA